jgi:predicted permease
MSWVKRLFLRRRMYGELSEEIRAHIAERIDELVADGLTKEDAAPQARREFGNVTLTEERAREVWQWPTLESLWMDIRHAMRQLRRNPGFTLVVILTLALGIGINTAMFTVVNGVLLRPMPFPNPHRLLLVSFTPARSPFEVAAGLLDRHYLEFRKEDRLFGSLASFDASRATLTGVSDPEHLQVANVTPDFFTVLRVNPAAGRIFAADENQPGRDAVAILGNKLWRNRFGSDSHILGKEVRLDGTRRTVVGVMPAGFNFPHNADVWLPLQVQIDPHNSFMRPVVGRLKDGVSAQQAQLEIQTISRHFWLDSDENRSEWRARVVPLKELLVADVRATLLIFGGAVGFVLLIGCANVANLMLARAAGRRKEMATRAALGAPGSRLLRQMLTESVVLSLAGGIAGVLFAFWGVATLIRLAPPGTLPRTELIQVDRWVLAFTLGLSVITGILFGLLPALQAARQDLRDALTSNGRGVTGSHERLHGLLVVSEIALALMLLTGAGLMTKSFLRLRAVRPGFEPRNVVALTVDLPEQPYRTAQQLKEFDQLMLSRLSNLPGVLAAGAVNWRPLDEMLTKGDFQLEGGRKLPPGFMVDKLCVSAGYLRAMGIRLRRGRDFTDSDDATAPGVVIISQSVAQSLWPGADPIGKRISMEDDPKPQDWLTIIGVVDDVKQRGLAIAFEPATYQPYLQVKESFFLNHVTFTLRAASDTALLAAAAHGVLRQIDKDLPALSLAPMEDLIAATTGEPRFQARLLVIFAVLALLLAAVGIYGVLAYSVAQRTSEIGIRMALGAQSSDVLLMVLRRTFRLVCSGILIGTTGALALTRMLEKFLFEVKPADPATLATVAFILVCAALMACSIPARRATRVDPVVALRHE